MVAKFLLKEGGNIMFKKDLLIFSLIILIFLLVLLLFIVLIWKENHLTQLWIRWKPIILVTLNTAILNVPLIFYEVSFICIHGNIKTTYFQVVFSIYIVFKWLVVSDFILFVYGLNLFSFKLIVNIFLDNKKTNISVSNLLLSNL